MNDSDKKFFRRQITGGSVFVVGTFVLVRTFPALDSWWGGVLGFSLGILLLLWSRGDFDR